MTRWSFPAILALTLLFLMLPAPQAQADEPMNTTISGGSLSHAIRLAPSDEDSFRRRINSPPRLDSRPSRAKGSTVTLTSDYWATFLNRPGRSPVEATADYYVASGIVKARQGSVDVWLALDLRQQAIISRYMRAAATIASERPGALNVLAAAAKDEAITLEVSGKPVKGSQATALWSSFSQLTSPRFVDPAQSPDDDPQGYWLVFGLPEGRSLQFHFLPGATPGLTDSLGAEQYTVAPDLAAMLTALQSDVAPIGDSTPPGSKLWWLLLIAGGIACLAGAVWFTRHPWDLPLLGKRPSD